MLYSNERKLVLSGWLKKNDGAVYGTSLKLQKFLFLYEAFTKAANEQPDFDHLRGYKRGPVFSNVWGDYTKDRFEFDAESEAAYARMPGTVNSERAQKIAFIVRSLSERELSEFTHKMNIWSSKANRIIAGEQQVELCEEDFSLQDIQLIKALDQMYPLSMIMNSVIIPVDNIHYVFSKADAEKITEQHFDTLLAIAYSGELQNPVYVTIDSEGRLLVD